MPLRNCTKEGCTNVAERYAGNCMLCAHHMCASHLRPESHTCPTRDSDPDKYFAAYAVANRACLAALLSKVNVAALQAVATEARGDCVSCTIPALFDDDMDTDTRCRLVSEQCGGQNCHVDIVFADGVTWLARLRLDDPLLLPVEAQNRVLLSEVATLQFLSRTRVPVPRVFGYALGTSPGNTVGTSYVLMEKLPGKPLDWDGASQKMKNRVMDQLADVYLELEKHPLPMTGSLSVTPSNEIQVGSFAQLPCFQTPDTALGPFSSIQESYEAILSHQMATLVNGECSALPLDNYLSFLWRQQTLPQLVGSAENKFYLKHYDDKGDHILVDDNGTITGIIDWEWASAEAKPYAFSSPCMMWPVGDYYDGKNELADDETRFASMFDQRGRTDLGDLVRNGRKWQRYLFFLGGGIPRDMDEFVALFQGLRASFAPVDTTLSLYDEWKVMALHDVGDNDPQLQALIQK